MKYMNIYWVELMREKHTESIYTRNQDYERDEILTNKINQKMK